MQLIPRDASAPVETDRPLTRSSATVSALRCAVLPVDASRRALTISVLVGLVALAGLALVLGGSSARAATATVDLRLVAPGQPGIGHVELDTSSFAAAESQILGLPGGTGLAVAWPEVDPGNALNAFDLGSADMTSYPATQTIVFEASASVPFAGSNSFDGLIVIDWDPAEPDPTISLGLRGEFELPTDTPVDVTGTIAAATAAQELEVDEAILFYGSDDKLAPGITVSGGTNIKEQLGDFALDAAPDIVTSAEIAGSIDTSVGRLLNDGTVDTNTSFSFSGTISAFGLRVPGAVQSSTWTFTLAYDQPADEFTVGGSAQLTLDDPVLADGELVFDAAVEISTSGAATLSGSYAGTTPFEPFDLGVGVTAVGLDLDLPGGGGTPTLTVSGSMVVEGVALDLAVTVGNTLAASLSIDDVSLGTITDTLGEGIAGTGVTLPTLPEPVRRVRIVNTEIAFEIDDEDQLSASFQSSVVLPLEGVERSVDLFVEFDPDNAIFSLQLPDGLTLGDITSANLESAFSAIPIPSGSIVISENTLDRADLSEAAEAALAPRYCSDTEPDCEFEVASGLGFTAGIRFPDLDDALAELWVAPGSEFRVTGQFPIFGGGGAFSLEAQLPTIQPPANSPEAQWFKSANLGIAIEKDGSDLSFRLEGDMSIQFPDEPAPITFFASATLSISPTEVSFTLTGGIEGWVEPFGLEWLFIENATAEIKVFTGVRTGVELGVRLKARIGGTDNGDGTMSGGTVIDGSVAIGVSTPGPIVLCNCSIEFGLRLYASSLTRADLVSVANQFGASIDAGSLPDFAMKNVEFSFSTIESEALCLQRGFIIGGDIHLGDGSSTVTDADPDRDLSSCGSERTSETDGAARCSASSTCLVHLRLEVTTDGIVAGAALGDFELDPITVEDANVSLRLTSSEQSFRIGGKIAIDGLLSVEGEVRLSTDGFSFFITTEDADGDERWTIAASAGIENGMPTAFSLEVSVKSEFFADFSEGLSGFVADAADFFTGGNANLDVIRVRCFTFGLQIGGVNDDGIDTNGSINGEIKWTATPNQGGAAVPYMFSLNWDFDESVATNLAGFASASPVPDTTGCGEPPVGTVFGLDNGTGVPGGSNFANVDPTAYLTAISTPPVLPGNWSHEMLTGQLVTDPGVFAVQDGEQITLATAFRADEQASYQAVFRVPGRATPVVRTVGLVTDGDIGYAEFTYTGSLPADSEWIQGVATVEIRVTGTTEPIVTEQLPFSLYRDGLDDIDLIIPATIPEASSFRLDAEFDLPPAPLDLQWRYEVSANVPFTDFGSLDPFIFQPDLVEANPNFPTDWERRFATKGAINTHSPPQFVNSPLIRFEDDGEAVITIIIENATTGAELARHSEGITITEFEIRASAIRFDSDDFADDIGTTIDNTWLPQPVFTTTDLTFDVDFSARDNEGDGPWTFVTSTSDGASTSTEITVNNFGVVAVDDVVHTLVDVPVGLVEFNATLFDKDDNATATYTRDVLVVPPNDDIANKIPFAGESSITGTTARATHGGAIETVFVPQCMVWYSWTPPSTGTFLVEITATRASDGSDLYTSVIEPVTGDEGDTFGGLTLSAADLSPIELGVYNFGACDVATGALDPAETGPFELSIRSTPPIQDDALDGIATNPGLVADTATLEVNTENATAEPGEPGFSPALPARKTVWFVAELDPFGVQFDGYDPFMPGGRLRVSTAGSDYDTVLSVYVEHRAGTGVPGATLIDRNDDGGPGLTSEVTFELHDHVDRTLEFAQRILVQVDGFNGAAGNLDITVDFLPPVNDTPATAIDVAPGGGTNPSVTVGHTFKPADADGVWYRYQPQEDLLIEYGLNGDHGVQAYRDDGGTLTELDFPRIQTFVGETYLFEVQPLDGDRDRFEFLLGRAPLENDDRADAPELFENLTVTTSNVTATLEQGEPNHAGRPVGASIWYEIQPVSPFESDPDPSLAVPWTVTTSNSSFDTVLAVYREGPGGELIEVDSNDDFGGTLDSQVRFDAGNDRTTYWVALSGYAGAEGFTEVELREITDNDFRVNRTRIIGNHALDFGEFPEVIGGGPRTEFGEPTPSCSFGGDPIQHTEWWVWTAPSNDPVDLDTRESLAAPGGPLDTQIAVYTEENGILTEVACDEDGAGPSFESFLRFEPVAGTEYFIQVDTFGGDFGTARVSLSPAGDYLENANPLSGASDFDVKNNDFGTSIIADFDLAFPTADVIPNCHPENQFTGDVHGLWWTWQAPSDGSFTFNTIGSSIDTVIGVWEGDTPVQGEDDCDLSAAGGTAELTIAATAGQTYSIQVDTVGGRGDIHLAVNPAGLASLCKGVAVTVDIGDGDAPTAGDDVVLGTSGDDVIDALAGDDIVCGEGGRDFVLGGPGDDLIYGGPGNDQLFGDADDDTVQGDAGSADECFLGTGTDIEGPGCETVQDEQDCPAIGAACDPDDDDDTVLDIDDNCPVTPNTNQADQDGDGQGDACDSDVDGDTVPDATDNCPTDPNTNQADVDGDGLGDVCDDTDDRPIEPPDDGPDDREVFASTSPSRFADSRDQPTFDGRFRNTGKRQSETTWEIQIAGRGGVPADASAAVVNVTVVAGEGPGFATVYPCGDRPTASSVNYGAGTVDPNEVVAKLSPTGSLCVFTKTTAHVIVDVVGTITDSPYRPLTPARFADSRNQPTFDNRFRNTGKRGGGTIWEIEIAGRGDVPSDASAAVVNVTVTGGEAPGFATVYPCTAEVPRASSLNYGPGITIPNELIAKLSSAGSICVFTLSDVHVIADVVGYLDDGSTYRALTPSRFADSRDQPTFDGQFRDTGKRGTDTVWEIQIAGRGEVPVDATNVVANLTVTGGTGPGFATVYPCDERPTASSINYGLNTTRPNELIAKLSPTGSLCVYTKTETHVIIDIVGFG